MQLRDAEDGHHRVADELLDGAAVPLEIAFISSKYRPSRRAQGLGVESLAERGRPDDVAEEDVTTLRYSRSAAAGSARSAPQALQKLEPSGLSRPQAGQVSMSEGYDAQLAAKSSSRQSLQWPSPL